MKELSIEEKAKAYDEIIEKATKMHNENCDACKACIEELIHELAESEDEKIRKELLDFCKNRAEIFFNDPKYKNISAWIAWLEKQGEHKKFRDSIQVGDKVTRNKDGILVNLSQLKRIAKPAEKQDKQKAKYHDVCNKCVRQLACQSDCFLQQGEQKPAWSEEDERNINALLYLVEANYLSSEEPHDRLINFLKSFRPKAIWKPSDEQMKALKQAKTDACGKPYFNALASLYVNLKGY